MADAFLAGEKSGPDCVASWTQCAQVGSYVVECQQHAPMFTKPEDYVDQCLDSSDVLDAVLRSLAANLRYRKTNDSESADRMRGLAAPGDEMTLAWLVDGSIEYSRAVHQQKAYLSPIHHRPSPPAR